MCFASKQSPLSRLTVIWVGGFEGEVGFVQECSVVAIQEILVKDQIGSAKGEWVGGVGLGGAGLLLGAAEIKVEREEEEEEKVAGQ